MTHYLFQIMVFQLLFLVVYDKFFKDETFFKWNRLYLIISPVLSLILPLMKIDFIRQNIPDQFIYQLPSVLIGEKVSTGLSASETLDAIIINSNGSFSWTEIWESIWLFGMLLSLSIFCFKLYKISRFKKLGSKSEVNGMNIFSLPNTDTAFSFFSNVFLGEQLSEVQKANILLHEKIHIEHRHTADLIFFEVLRILFWFNPLVYVFQNKMILLQEFTADAEVAAQSGKKAYYEELLSQVFKTESISFINTFFNHSLIKKRILMLQKSKSKKIFQLKYLMLIPVITAMLVYTSCSTETKEIGANLVKQSDTQVMDKINELAEAIMEKGEMTEEELLALKFLSKEYKEGDKVYTSVEQYLEENRALEGRDSMDESNTEVSVSFSELDKVPTFPGCEGLDVNATKKCFAEKISEFIGAKFKTEDLNKLDLQGRQKITAKFVIGKEGIIKDIQVKANHPDLEAEALRTLQLLPQMIPGELDGKKVSVMYSLPIIFDI